MRIEGTGKDNLRPALLRLARHAAETPDALLTAFRDAIPAWTEPGKVVFTYSESPQACTLSRAALQSEVLPEDVWGGRLFNCDGEARWVRTETSLVAWTTREVELADQADGDIEVRYEEPDRRYYLIGEWPASDSARKRFAEARYPSVDRFDYPVDHGSERQPRDRAYILVREYAPAVPSWAVLANGEPGELRTARIESALNWPRLAGHRFITVDAGQG